MTPLQIRARLDALRAELPDGPGRVHLRLDGSRAELVLDNPTERTAFSLRMMSDLAAALDAILAWDGSVVVVRSTCHRVFCAGAHLGDIHRVLASSAGGAEMTRLMGSLLDALRGQPAVVIAALRGLAVGGGAELLTACDHRVAVDGARVRFLHGTLGLAPGWGGAGRLVEIVGRRQALRLLTTARPVGASEAHRLGLVDAVAPDLDAGLEDFVTPILRLPPAAVRAMKSQVVAARPPRALEAEARAFGGVWWGPAHLEQARARGLL